MWDVIDFCRNKGHQLKTLTLSFSAFWPVAYFKYFLFFKLFIPLAVRLKNCKINYEKTEEGEFNINLDAERKDKNGSA